jgi:hypothetical protein
MKRLSLLLLGLVLLAACDDTGTGATAAPSVRTLTGPTIAPSATFYPNPPTPLSFDDQDFGQNNPTAAALPAEAQLPPLAVGTAVVGSSSQHIQITAADGTLLDGDLYQSGDVRMPGVLMLAADRTAWGDFPAKVHDAGFTVLVVNIRQLAPASDFTVMLQSLSSGEADPARLAVMGADSGADAALLGCADDLLCDALVLLSPSGNDALLSAVSRFNPRALFLSASQDDAVSYDMAQRLQTAANGSAFFQPFTSAGHGTDMLVNRADLSDLIIQWLLQHV